MPTISMPAPDPCILRQAPAIVAALSAVLPADAVISDLAETRAYECDALTAYRQLPLVVVLPETVEQVAAVLKYCHGEGIKVVPRGSGTSLSGGALPLEHPIAVKEAVLPFNRFRRPDGSLLDTLLSPEMKSTGEVMGLATNFGAAYAKGEIAAFAVPPTEGTVFVSVANRDKRTLIFPIQRLANMGYNIVATAGTAQMLRRNGIECEVAAKVSEAKEGEESIVDKIFNGEIDWILNTPAGSAGARHDGYDIRAAAVHIAAQKGWIIE